MMEEYKGESAPTFEQAIKAVINNYGVDNDLDTPDFVLARYVATSLEAYARANSERERLEDLHHKGIRNVR